HPGAVEVAGDDVDQDCDGRELCFVDADGDGFRGASPVEVAATVCVVVDGYYPASAPADCDDDAGEVHPGADEVAGDGVDQDCDQRELCYVDADLDGDRVEETALSTGLTCLAADGLALADAVLDCDDADDAVHHG